LKLEDLNTVRVAHKVYIDWDEETKCLRIYSRCGSQAEDNIVEAVKGIRQAILNAKARAISASPVYIVMPPTTSAWRSEVQPVFPSELSIPPLPTVTILRLSGQRLSEKAALVWESGRNNILQSNIGIFREHLIKSLLDLSPFRGWMRMRLHFGHLALKQYRKELLDPNFSFAQYSQMMKSPRTRGQFNRK